MRRPKGTHPIYWSTFNYLPPDDWSEVAIAQMADVTKGKLPKTFLTRPTEKSVPYLLIDGLNDGVPLHTEDADLPMITPEDTIVVADGSRSGLPIRGVAGALGSTLLRYRAKDGFNGDYLYYLLESLYPFTNTATIGGAVPHLDKRLLSQLMLAMPEQPQRTIIGRILRAVDQMLSTTKDELSAAQRLKTTLMQQLFTKGIPGRHKQFKGSKWLSMPKSWTIKPLHELADVTSGFTMGRDLSNHRTAIVPYVTVINVQDGFFNLGNIGSVQIKESELETGLLKSDDVLMTEGGDRDKLGRGAIWTGQIDPCAYQNHIFRVRFRSDEYGPKLFHYLIQSWQAKRYFFSHAKQTNNLCTINSRELKKYPLGIPDPDEQEDIVEILDHCEHTLDAITTKLEALLRLKKSLLQNLLTGKVRVNMEANV